MTLSEELARYVELAKGVTQGEWERVGASKIWKTGEQGGAICIIAEPECPNNDCFEQVSIGSKRFEEAMANAAFIAAAPSMLTTLKQYDALLREAITVMKYIAASDIAYLVCPKPIPKGYPGYYGQQARDFLAKAEKEGVV